MNSEQQWSAVDEYLSNALLPRDEVLDVALKASESARLPSIQVSPCQGRLLQMLAQVQQARNILEIGTLGGYSTIWLARSLPPGGRLVTLELDPRHAEVARANIGRAGFSRVVDLQVGPAIETLPRLAKEGLGPFDFIFIDADKASTAAYFDWAMKLSRRGSLIVVDNVIRKGAVIDPDSSDPAVCGMRKFFESLGVQKRVTATAIQTVGMKGYDGFAVVLVTGELVPTNTDRPV